MLQKNNKYRILKVFFEQPTAELQLRQICRLAKIAPPSTKKYLQELESEGLVSKSKKNIYPVYRAVRDSQLFKSLKKWSLAIELSASGAVDYISEKCSPDAIIVFGSAARGEDIEQSDIDLAILAEDTVLDLKKYGKLLNRKITPFFAPKFSELSKELKNNILNGILLYGYVKVF
jgi:predicted nucleotidyltransferase